MFKYTPKPQILRDMQVPKTPGTRWWDKEYFRRQDMLKKFHLPQDYTLTCILETNYPKVSFCSKTRVRFVPVNGYLFPVEMFNEEVL